MDSTPRPPLFVHPSNARIADYIVYTTTDMAAHALNLDPTEKMRSSLLSLSDKMHRKHCGFKQFVSNVIRRSQTHISTVLVALLYLKRAKPHLDVASLDWILHRLFLGALILATKVSHVFASFRHYSRLLIFPSFIRVRHLSIPLIVPTATVTGRTSPIFSVAGTLGR